MGTGAGRIDIGQGQSQRFVTTAGIGIFIAVQQFQRQRQGHLIGELPAQGALALGLITAIGAEQPG